MPKVSEAFPRKYLNAETIGNQVFRVAIERVVTEQIDRDRRWVMYFRGAKKGLVLNRTNAEYLARAIHDDSDKWIGVDVDLFVELVDDLEGGQIPGIRVRLPKMPETTKAGDSEIPF